MEGTVGACVIMSRLVLTAMSVCAVCRSTSTPEALHASQSPEPDPAERCNPTLGAGAKPRARGEGKRRLLSASLNLSSPTSQLPRRLELGVKIATNQRGEITYASPKHPLYIFHHV
jgi:hypothetical protein